METVRPGLTNVTFRRADASALRLPDASFDAVVSSLGTPEGPVDEEALSPIGSGSSGRAVS